MGLANKSFLSVVRRAKLHWVKSGGTLNHGNHMHLKQKNS